MIRPDHDRRHAERELAGSRLAQLLDRAANRVDRDVRDREVAEQQRRDHECGQERRPVRRLDHAAGTLKQRQAQREADEGAQEGTRELDDSCHWVGSIRDELCRLADEPDDEERAASGGHLSTPIPTRPRIGQGRSVLAGSGLERDCECLPDVSRHDEAGRRRGLALAARMVPVTRRSKPSRDASSRRRSARTAERSRPDSATSPASTVPRRTGRSRRLEARAAAIARSAAGSSMRRPPATLTYTSWPERFRPAWRARTAISISTRLVSIPVVARRGVP